MSTTPAESANPLSSPVAATQRPNGARSPRVHHNYRALDRMCESDDAWLSDRERAELAAWHNADRRRAWLAGRSLGKALVAELVARLDADRAGEPPRIEILSRDAEGRVNRPRIWCDGIERPWSLSISHSERGALAALTASADVAIGVDLAERRTLSDGFVDLWFTAAERAWFHETQSSHTACFIWAAKEAIYKASSDGESFVPRDVEVLPDGRCSYRGVRLDGCTLQSWTVDGHLAVLAAVPSRRNSSSSLSSLTGNHP
jgi:phosphopantetheinyl transferase